MTLDEFISAFADQFDETAAETFSPTTVYRELDEWSSLIALSIISMVDDEMGKQLTGSELRTAGTIENLYNIIQAK